MAISQSRLIAIAVVAVGVLIVLANTLYVVDQRQQAIVLRFGEPLRVVNAFRDNDPGLKIKAPFLENVILLDKRNLALEADQEEIIAADQERLVVDAFIRYRIADPLQFYRTLRDERTADDRLERLVNSSPAPGAGLGVVQRHHLRPPGHPDAGHPRGRDHPRPPGAARHRGDRRADQARRPARRQPQAVYRRMQTSRQQEAAQIRAVGEQQKREIMAGADREVTVTLATATEQSVDAPEARATRGGPPSSPRPTAATRPSPPSSARCRPMTERWPAATPP